MKPIKLLVFSFSTLESFLNKNLNMLGFSRDFWPIIELAMYYFRDPADNNLKVVADNAARPVMKACASNPPNRVVKWPSFVKCLPTMPVIYTIRSLRDVMFEFVVENLNLVESFVGLPEMIVEEIFASEFSTSQLKRSCLHLAINASPILLQDFCVSSQTLATKTLCDNLYIDATCERLLIREIDISREMLTFIGNFQRLTVLQLDCCRLFDGDIRLLVNASSNPLTGGLKNLEMLSLCCNHGLTNRSLIFLRSLPSLHLIRICERSEIAKTKKAAICGSEWKYVDIQPAKDQFCERDQENWLKVLLYEDKYSKNRVEKENINYTDRDIFTEEKLSKKFYKPMKVQDKCSSSNYVFNSQHRECVKPCDVGTRRYLEKVRVTELDKKKTESKKRKLREISAPVVDIDLLKYYL